MGPLSRADGFTDRCHTCSDLLLCVRMLNFAPYSPDDHALAKVWAMAMARSLRLGRLARVARNARHVYGLSA